ncbi:hypothetical protein [Phenylobacterium sp.]|uniref:terminase small subunit-like protein n=1 Tax=Phenylobacterium sp. TaxID=1871053 RepID=UPI0027319C51|nr:hypothetical protein [Phenylobacterium sp.]MDP1873650.1 hypothetical protein [Phenylobacterium sp.]
MTEETKLTSSPTARFEDDIVVELLKRTEAGEPLLRICSDPKMPARRSVYDWIENDPEFSSQFHDARKRGIHALAEQCLDIADEPSKDAVAATDKRIRIDTRLRLAGKWLPSIYGDKVLNEHTGKDGGPIQTYDLSKADDGDLEKLEALLSKVATGGEA